MKILLLADPASTHTIKWVNSLAEKGYEIFLFGLSEFNIKDYNPGVKIKSLSLAGNIKGHANGSVSKVYYLSGLLQLKKIIKTFKPDLVHAHYATSYGLLGALTGFHPLIISAWGTDILKFPEKSFIHKKILEFSLRKANRVLATSSTLGAEVSKYYNGNVIITPFGVDTNYFASRKAENIILYNSVVIGTIKTMEDYYGIEYLIRAFKLVKDRNPGEKINLLLVGGGSKIEKYKTMASQLGISDDIFFAGYIEHEKVPDYHNMMDVEVFLSEYESFGVSVLEASACEKPVIVNRVGGLTEVVENNVTGLFVEPGNIEDAAAAIEILIIDKPLRELLGKNGRQKVLDEYSWQASVDKMIKVYNEVLINNNTGKS